MLAAGTKNLKKSKKKKYNDLCRRCDTAGFYELI
jgi:ribosomal protein L37E